MVIKRDQYVNRLIAAKHDNFIKVIIGIRRAEAEVVHRAVVSKLANGE